MPIDWKKVELDLRWPAVHSSSATYDPKDDLALAMNKLNEEDFSGAISVLHTIHHNLSKIQDHVTTEHLMAVHLLMRTLHHVREYTRAQEVFEDMRAFVSNVSDVNSETMADFLVQSTEVLVENDMYEEAFELVAKAAEIFANLTATAEVKDKLRNCYQLASSVSQGMEDLPSAIESLLKALELAAEQDDKLSADVLDLHYRLAMLYVEADQPKRNDELVLPLIDEIKDNEEPNMQLRLANLYSVLAYTEFAKNKPQQGLVWLQQELKVRRALRGKATDMGESDMDIHTIDCLAQMSVAYEMLGDMERALRLAQQSRLFMEKAAGTESDHVIDLLEREVLLHQNLKDKAQALECAQLLVDRTKASLGPLNKRTRSAMRLLASVRSLPA